MSDNEHRQPDTRTSGTYSQQADAIRMNGYIMLRNRPCKITGIDKFRIGKHGHAKYKFMATGIFTGDEFEDIVPSSHNCDVPNVTVYDYQLINISSEDGFVSLLIENNITKDDIKLPTDERLLHQTMTNTMMHERGPRVYLSIVGVAIPTTTSCNTMEYYPTMKNTMMHERGPRVYLSIISVEIPTTTSCNTMEYYPIKDRFAEGHKLVVTVVSAMGEEQIRAVKYDLGPK